MVKVTLREYGFDYAPPASPGRVLFEVTNAGKLEHDLALQPLANDLPPIDEQLRGPQRRVVVPFAGVPPVPAGGRGIFAVDLAPGRRYALICFVVDPDGTTHGVKGMNAEFRTGEGASPRPPP